MNDTTSTNLLASEKSPYLQQHAENPVHWRPWGEEAMAAARKADKPLLISIGYSTCHWCHVMERESFEDEAIAAKLNETFVCVKVDREERPDVDAVYMTACQMTTGRGGWPLTIFATPDGEPFFAATYLPPHSRMGHTGLAEMTDHVRRLWNEERNTLLDAAGKLSGHLGQFYSQAAKGGDMPGLDALDAARGELSGRYDQRHGGYGEAPKFPTPHNLVFMLREAKRIGDKAVFEQVMHTLAAMRLGGIWDHVGHGFHRYSTDEKWLLPHFEKMLYDQAAMALAYLEGFQASGAPLFARTAEEIFEYVLRDLASPEGGLYCAEDADSEGEEGKFYVWTAGEVVDILGADDGSFVTTRLRMEAQGNFRDEATGEQTGVNIPFLRRQLPAKEEIRWEPLRLKLLAEREKRIRPGLDDKILADWNGLMITALARGARILGRPDLLASANRAADFVLTRMRTDDGAMLHRWREGEAAVAAHADDYAAMIRACLELYATTYDASRLEQAVELQKRMDTDFLDAEGGGYFLSAAQDAGLPARPKELYDGPVPSANSTALCNLVSLYRLTGDTAFGEQARALAASFAGNVASQPSAFTHFLTGLSQLHSPGPDVVVAGVPGAADTEALLSLLRTNWLPGLKVLFRNPDDDTLPRIAPFTKEHRPIDGKASAYVCRDFTCSTPVTTPGGLADLLREG